MISNLKFLIRFGVHRDRETIKDLEGSISGVVIPAHILCYSTNATIAAISLEAPLALHADHQSLV